MSQCCTSLPCTGWAELCTTLSHAFTFFLFPSLFCAPERLPAKCATSLLFSPSILCPCPSSCRHHPSLQEGSRVGTSPTGMLERCQGRAPVPACEGTCGPAPAQCPQCIPLPLSWVPPLALRGTGWCLSAIFLRITFFK